MLGFIWPSVWLHQSPKQGKDWQGSRFMAKRMVLGHLERSIFPGQCCQGQGSLGRYFMWCCAVCTCWVVYRHCGSMLKLFRELLWRHSISTLQPDIFHLFKHWMFLSKDNNCVESLGVAQTGSIGWWLNWGLRMEVMGKTMWMKMTPVTSFDKVGSLEEMGKRKKRSQVPVAENIREDICMCRGCSITPRA